MTSLENLHYAIGELAYAVACADGTVQHEERTKFHNIVATELESNHRAFDISAIIFRLMEKDKTDPWTTYDWAMKEIRLNSHYLSPELKQKFIAVMEKVAEAFLPVTASEQKIIDRFKKDIEAIHGDPVFYEKVV